MKLGPLKSAIRKMSEAPKVGGAYETPEGRVELTDLCVTKQSLIAALDRAFPEGSKGTETGLWLKSNGHIGIEGSEETTGESSQEPIDDGDPVAEGPAADEDDLARILG